MNCPQCGDVCRCPSEPLLPASPRWKPDREPGLSLDPVASPELDLPAAQAVAIERVAVEDNGSPSAADSALTSDPEAAEPSQDGDASWRDELSARLDRYRSRRKVRPPRYPSLSLKFEAPEMFAGRKNQSTSPLADFEPVSNHALALDGMSSASSSVAEAAPEYSRAPEAKPSAPAAPQPSHQSSAQSKAKIIEFPRFAWGPPPPPPDQLAEPVSERPRILEVPETAAPLPALGGITIEPVEQPEPEKRPGIDLPLQSAPLGLRLVAALLDGVIVAAAASLFGLIFWKIDAIRPPMIQTLGLAVGISCLFWATYQYLLVVYAASTPGLRVAGLELARFDGTSTTRSLRRWRVLASWLSAVSAGMGYVWVFLDEDALCWHDRITHTYLAPRRHEPKTGD
jgi:uncharacterized RDD family membrane protein YckC